jgi:hypothetical protein
MEWRCARQCSARLRIGRLHRAIALYAGPVETALDAARRGEAQTAGDAIQRPGGLAATQRCGQRGGLVAKGEHARITQAVRAPRTLGGQPHVMGRASRVEHPRHLEQPHACQVAIGGALLAHPVAGDVGGDVAGVVEAEQWIDLPHGLRLEAGRENRIDARGGARIEGQLAAENALQLAMALAARVDAQCGAHGGRDVLGFSGVDAFGEHGAAGLP